MDQRAKGGPSLPPPSSLPLLPTAPPQQYPEKEVGGGTRKRTEKEGGGAVLEVLIEGCCGAAGQRQLPFPGRERSCTEGNVRLRIGVQAAKRTKKPPRTLEGYECKPTIRTYQRPGRGSQEVGGSGQGNRPQEEGDGEQNQGSDPSTTQTRKIHSSLPPSSSSSSSAPTTTPPSPANPQTAPAKQVGREPPPPHGIPDFLTTYYSFITLTSSSVLLYIPGPLQISPVGRTIPI